MRYSILSVGRGRNRRILGFWTSNDIAVRLLNALVLDYGFDDVVCKRSSIAPPSQFYCRPLYEILRDLDSRLNSTSLQVIPSKQQ